MPNWAPLWKCFTLFYVILNFVSGLAEASLITYVILRRHNIQYFFEGLWKPLLWSFLGPVTSSAISILGWWAITRKRPKWIKGYAVLMAAIVIVQWSFAIWSFAGREQLPKAMTTSLEEKFRDHYVNQTLKKWDVLYTQMHCCGVNGPEDYKSQIHADYGKVNKVMPVSCMSSGELYKTGCLTPLKEAGKEDYNIAIIAIVLVTVIQAPSIFLTWAYSNRLQQNVSTITPEGSRDSQNSQSRLVSNRPRTLSYDTSSS